MGNKSVAPARAVKRLSLGTVIAIVTAASLVGPVAGGAPASTRAVSVRQAVEIAADHLRDERTSYGLGRRDVRELAVTDAYRSRHNGITHVYLAQEVDGLEVAGSSMTVNVGRDGDIVHVGERFIAGLRSLSRTPLLDPVDAVGAAARHLGLPAPAGLRVTKDIGGVERRVVMSSAGISLSPIPARLVWHPVRRGALRLAWNLQIEETSELHWWNISIDARTGRALSQVDYVIHEDVEDLAAGNVEPSQRRAVEVRVGPRKRAKDGSEYRVYRLPLESPNDGKRTLEKNPADRLASPYGWHDTDGRKGHDSTVTNGNNAHAYVDYSGVTSIPVPVLEVDGGESLTFDFEKDQDEKVPHFYRAAAVTNLFYWNNIIHDVLYRYGFDERSGNFQVDNYGRAGEDRASDSVRAEAQDHGGVNNANFATPPDGERPRMQMYLWPNIPKRSIIDGDFDAGVIIHEYGHGVSNRLTGGPDKSDCLQQIQEQPGEGWSDWIAIAMTALPSERGPQPRGMGTFVLGQDDRKQKGIRPTPYSTNMAINPATYKTIASAAAPHGVGYVWATMLWEVYWNLVDKHGFNPNPYGSWRSGGNNLAMQLVMDGMKFQPCKPGFVDARDAILAADRALTGGDNQCEIWTGFAKRGLGYRAKQKTPESKSDGVENFSTHPRCR